MRRVVAVVGTLALLSLAAKGQEPARPPGAREEEFRVRVRVELVTIPVSIFDQNGEFVYGLTRDDFRVWDKGVPQRLSQFAFESPPISLVLLLNTSKRVKPLLDRVRASAILFHSYILGETGEAALITFDDEVRLREAFTQDAARFEQAVKNIKVGGDGTRLADGLDYAIRLLLPRPAERRKVVVIISEPRDVGSETPLGEPLRVAQLADITIYAVNLSYMEALWKTKPQDRPVPSSPFPPGVFPTPPMPGTTQTPTSEQQNVARANLLAAIMVLVQTLRAPLQEDVLEILTAGTGGAYHKSYSDVALQAAINQIGQELHNQYVLAYRPSNVTEPGYHDIQVRVRRGDVWVRARPGYYIGPPE